MPAGSPAAGPESELVAVDDDVVVPPLSPESPPESSPDEPQAAARAISRIRADFFTLGSRVNEPAGRKPEQIIRLVGRHGRRRTALPGWLPPPTTHRVTHEQPPRQTARTGKVRMPLPSGRSARPTTCPGTAHPDWPVPEQDPSCAGASRALQHQGRSRGTRRSGKCPTSVNGRAAVGAAVPSEHPDRPCVPTGRRPPCRHEPIGSQCRSASR